MPRQESANAEQPGGEQPASQQQAEAAGRSAAHLVVHAWQAANKDKAPFVAPNGRPANGAQGQDASS